MMNDDIKGIKVNLRLILILKHAEKCEKQSFL